jgi:hypothetical protein
MPKIRSYRGKPIREAKYPLQITVGADDVKNAKRKNPEQCAIARSVMHDKHVLSARIGRKFALVEYDSHFERYHIPKSTQEGVKEFDGKGTFIAGTYKLAPVPKSMQLTGKMHSPPAKKRKSGISKNKDSIIRRPANRNIFRAAQV